MGVMAGLTVGMAALQMGSQIMGGIQAKQQGENEAIQYEQQAREAHMAASGKIISDDYQAIQVMNRMAAGTAAGGMGSGGSEKYVQRSTAEEARINDMYTRYSGRLAASSDYYAASQARWEGSQKLGSAIIGAIGTGASAGMGTYKGLTYGWGSSGGGP
jgi:hypothetical protein